MVRRRYCQKFSFATLCSVVHEGSWSIATIVMSSQEWLSELKCLPTGKSILLVVMDDLWLLTLMLSLSFVSPTYCLPHTRQVIRYTTFLDLQLRFSNILYSCLVLVLLNDEVVCVWGQSLHLLSVQVSKQPIGRGLSRSDNVVLDTSRLSESNHWGDGNGFVHPLGFVESW